jgi:hypothetical protein
MLIRRRPQRTPPWLAGYGRADITRTAGSARTTRGKRRSGRVQGPGDRSAVSGGDGRSVQLPDRVMPAHLIEEWPVYRQLIGADRPGRGTAIVAAARTLTGDPAGSCPSLVRMPLTGWFSIRRACTARLARNAGTTSTSASAAADSYLRPPRRRNEYLGMRHAVVLPCHRSGYMVCAVGGDPPGTAAGPDAGAAPKCGWASARRSRCTGPRSGMRRRSPRGGRRPGRRVETSGRVRGRLGDHQERPGQPVRGMCTEPRLR